ncbi:MAG: hypothetical protein OXD39_06455 [Gemmatimonadetes bacterium]|nr:hypothetical protein [Gemmatimonadota bacterium]
MDKQSATTLVLIFAFDLLIRETLTTKEARKQFVKKLEETLSAHPGAQDRNVQRFLDIFSITLIAEDDSSHDHLRKFGF